MTLDVYAELFDDDPNAVATNLPAADVFSMPRTSRIALQRLTGRWGVLVVAALKLEVDTMRFGEYVGGSMASAIGHAHDTLDSLNATARLRAPCTARSHHT